MPSHRETFFEADSFVIIGQTAKRTFPKLTYGNLRKRGKQVFPVDLSGESTIEGDAAFAAVSELPMTVDAAIVEVPKDTTMDAVTQVADAGIKNLWIHMGCETPEVLAFCKEQSIDVRHGTCAVMYTQQGFSFHSIHKGVMKLIGKY